MGTSSQRFAPSDIPWAAGTPKLCHFSVPAQEQAGLPVPVIHGGLGNQHLTGTSPGFLLHPVQLQLLSLEIELREAWAFPFAQMRWGVLRGRGCYNWITHCVTNHSAGNHSDCGFNLTWSFPSHRMTQPSAAGMAHPPYTPHPPCQPVRAWIGGSGTSSLVLLPSLCWWPSGQVWVGWECGHRADRTRSLWWGWASAKKSSSRSETGVLPRGRAQAWPRDKPMALYLCVWM